jgi:hypothetical protein
MSQPTGTITNYYINGARITIDPAELLAGFTITNYYNNSNARMREATLSGMTNMLWVGSGYIYTGLLLSRINVQNINPAVLSIKSETIRSIHYRNDAKDFLYALPEMDNIGIRDKYKSFVRGEVTMGDIVSTITYYNKTLLSEMLSNPLFTNFLKEMQTWLALYNYAEVQEIVENTQYFILPTFTLLRQKLLSVTDPKVHNCQLMSLINKTSISLSCDNIDFNNQKIYCNAQLIPASCVAIFNICTPLKIN